MNRTWNRWTRFGGAGFGFVAGAVCAGVFLTGGPVAALKNAIPKRVVMEEHALEGVDGKIVRMLSLEFAPGTTSAPHRHPGPVFGYVVSGAIRTSIGDGPATTYTAGESFYEPATALHGATENESETEPAHVIALMVMDQGVPELKLEH